MVSAVFCAVVVKLAQCGRAEHIRREGETVEEVTYIGCAFRASAFIGNTAAMIAHYHVDRAEKSDDCEQSDCYAYSSGYLRRAFFTAAFTAALGCKPKLCRPTSRLRFNGNKGSR